MTPSPISVRWLRAALLLGLGPVAAQFLCNPLPQLLHHDTTGLARALAQLGACRL